MQDKSWTELLMDDHQMTERVFEAVGQALQTPSGPSPKLIGAVLKYVTEYVDGCHNHKEEQHLFPLLERRGIPRGGGPLAVMLSEHEQSRGLLARLQPLAERYAAGDVTIREELASAMRDYSELLRNHFWKENDILYPMGRRVLSDQDDRDVVAGIESVEAQLGPDTCARYARLAAEIEQMGAIQDLSANLTPEVLAAVLSTLPVELSFVDDADRVRYFSHEHLPKIFPRTRGVIGKPVQQCHPPKSVHLVNRILEDFKANRRELAEFWIQMGERKVHIRYFPVRSPDGKYLGCLEVVQDITRIQQLQGERRLLQDAR